MKKLLVVTLLGGLLFMTGCFSQNGVVVHVTNQDAETIHILEISASNRIYKIKNIEPGQTKEIKIQMLGKTKITFVADSVALLNQHSTTYLSSIKKGEMKVKMTKNKIISSTLYTYK